MKYMNLQIKINSIISSKVNSKRLTWRYIIINLSKGKNKEIIESSKKKVCVMTYKVSSIRLSAYFSAELRSKESGMKYI